MFPINSIAVFALVSGLLATSANAFQVGPNSPPSATQQNATHVQRQLDRHWLTTQDGRFDARQFDLSKDELKLLRDLQSRVNSSKPSTAIEIAANATASVQSPDAKYILGALEIQLADKLGDASLRSAGTDMVIASGVAPAASLPSLLRNQGIMALDRNDLAKAEAAFVRLVGLVPNDADATVTLAQIKIDAGKLSEALPLFDEAIRLKKAANQPVPEVWMKVADAVRTKLGAGRP